MLPPCLFVWTFLAVICGVQCQNPMVTVQEGTLIGKTVNFTENRYINITKEVDLFLGVPFADPPERFKPPTKKQPWAGVRNATSFSASCIQVPLRFYPVLDEDCLYLNIYAPHPKPSNAAVMVWIHGGAFTTGSAMMYDYYGVPLVAVGDVIVVAINYRLGIFAQFSTEDDEAPGNFGMLDQVAALQWVYDNIAAFGGDRDRITIFGESAGSVSVSFHLVSSMSRPFFHQAIMQSGTVFTNWAFRDEPELEKEHAKQLGLRFNCDVTNSSTIVACLREVDAQLLRFRADRVYDRYPVTLDGTFLNDSPTNLYKKGDFKRASLLAGFNKDEGTLYPFFLYPTYIGSQTPPPISREEFSSYVADLMTTYGMGAPILQEAAIQEYTDWTIADDPAAEFFPSMVDIGGDFDFACPTDVLLRTHHEAGDIVLKYFMTHEPSRSIFESFVPPTPWLGAGHGEDLTYVFGFPFIEELYHVHGHNLTDEENALSVDFMTFWTNFAKSGDPSKSSANATAGTGRDGWPIYTIPELRHKEMSIELGEGRAIRADQCHFWNEYIPNLMKFTDGMDDLEQEWRESYSLWKTELADWQIHFEEYKEQPPCG